MELCCLEVSVQVSAVSPSSVVAASPQTCCLTISILLRGPATSPQAVELRITNPSEPLLLLSSVVAAADYPALRQNQGLLVEFNLFPQRLVELLQLCRQEQDSLQPKFVLVLSGAGPGLLTGAPGDGSAGRSATFANSVSSGLLLEVVESNPFKRLSHLSLSVCSASTHDKLCYLASCIDSLKKISAADHSKLQSSYDAVQGQLLQCKQQLQQCKEHNVRQQQESREAADKLQQRHQQQLQEEREKLLKERSDGDRRVSRVRSELEARATQQQRRLEALTADNRAAAEHRAHAEAALREVRERLLSIESSCGQLRAEQVQLRAGLAQAQEQLHGARSRGVELERRLDESEHKRAELQRSLQHTSYALDQAREKQSELEAALSTSTAKCSKRESSAAAVFMELQKSLQVIRSLQQKMHVLQQQKEDRDETRLKQEKALEGAMQRITALKGHLGEVEQQLKDSKQQVGELQVQKSQLQDQLTDSRERAATHEKAAAWLQQRLDEAEAAAALVERVPLAGVYLRAQPNGLKSTATASTTAMRGNSTSKRPQDSGGADTARGGEGSALATSTPLSAPLPPERGGPLRQAALNSLSAVRTPGGGRGGGLPPLHEDCEDNKENSLSGGLGPEYLTATLDKKSKSVRSSGLTVRGLIPARGRVTGAPSGEAGMAKDGCGAGGDDDISNTAGPRARKDTSGDGATKTGSDLVSTQSKYEGTNHANRRSNNNNNGEVGVTSNTSNRNSGLRGGLLRDTLAVSRPGTASYASSTARPNGDDAGRGPEKVIAVTAGKGENVHIIDTGHRPPARRGGGGPTWR